MKLGTLKKNSLDGELVVVNKAMTHFKKVANIATTFQEALESWATVKPKLESVYADLNSGNLDGADTYSNTLMHSPLPRAYQWLDGSAYIHHIVLVRKARNAEPPATLLTVPLMYQGGSDTFLAPTEDIPQVDFSHGTDFEGEVGVILANVPMGVSAEKALDFIVGFVLINDVSLRGLIPGELKNGFGFMQSKPSSAFSPVMITADELGEHYKEGRLHLPLNVDYNGKFFGKANAKEMHFHFGQLIAHAAKTRNLSAGTIIGSGTVSNENPEMGSSCLAEKRMIEKIETGEFVTPFMKDGDTIKISMSLPSGENLFGTIEQKIKSV